jgi:hypothetical protein
VSEPTHNHIERAYHELWHQVCGQRVLRAAKPPLQAFLHPLPFAIVIYPDPRQH